MAVVESENFKVWNDGGRDRRGVRIGLRCVAGKCRMSALVINVISIQSVLTGIRKKMKKQQQHECDIFLHEEEDDDTLTVAILRQYVLLSPCTSWSVNAKTKTTS